VGTLISVAVQWITRNSDHPQAIVVLGLSGIVLAYLAGDSDFYARTGSLAYCNYRGLPTAGAVFAGKAYDGSSGHKWFYDADTVIVQLREAGFAQAEARNLHESRLPRIKEIEPAYREIESFYVEAIL